MIKLMFLLLFPLSLIAQDKHLIINKQRANELTGYYGKYSALEPRLLPDTFYILPEQCIYDIDLIDARSMLLEAQSSGNSQNIDFLPAIGEQVYKDSIYKYEDKLVICRQSHLVTAFPPQQVPALFSFYRENSDTLTWIPNEYVLLGWKRIYNSEVYTVLQPHLTFETYRPDLTLGVLWSVEVSTPYWKAGVEYKVNNLVIYQVNGFTYKCLQAHTSISTWNPVAAASLWEKQ